MNNTIIFILAILDIMAELTQLTFEIGTLTRKVMVPVLVATYVIGEMTWEALTTYEFNVKVYNTPLTTGFA